MACNRILTELYADSSISCGMSKILDNSSFSKSGYGNAWMFSSNYRLYGFSKYHTEEMTITNSVNNTGHYNSVWRIL